MRCDILYCEGPGDIVSSFASWRRGDDFASETSVTFSSQIFAFCAERQLSLYALSSHSRAQRVADGRFRVENKPRWECRLPVVGYHLGLFVYAVRLLVLALKIRPRIILVCSGVVEWEFAALLKLSGALLVPVLHNALWPVGYRRRGLRQRVRDRVLRAFWRSCVSQTLAVSAALRLQVQELAGAHEAGPIAVFQPSFSRDFFGQVPARADFNEGPFRVLYVGRVEEDKGALDIVPMAAALLERRPGGYEFEVCGEGAALGELAARVRTRGLQAHVRLLGRLDRAALTERYLAAHVIVVPTRTSFTEGFAMVVAEALLCLRPVVSSAVVPATQTFASAVALATPDDVASYVDAIERLSQDRSLYERLVDAAQRLRPSILDEQQSFLQALRTLTVPVVSAAGAAPEVDDDEVVTTLD